MVGERARAVGERQCTKSAGEAKEGTYRYKISGVIDDHDYSKVPKCGDVKAPEPKWIKPFILPKEDDDTEDANKKNK